MAQEYIDTSALIALSDSNDANHDRAVQHLRDSLAIGTRFTLGKAVLIEFIDGVTKRIGKDKAIKELTTVLESKVVTVVLETSSDWANALSCFRKHKDRRVDLTDALNFSLMERMGIGTAFTFDSDFAAHGFTIAPAEE